MLPSAVARSSSSLRHFTRPTVRARRLFTSSFFLVTFCGAIVTVSLTTLLPCPARVAPGQYRRRSERREDAAAPTATTGADTDNLLQPGFPGASEASRPALVQGERVRLTKKGGWIEIDE